MIISQCALHKREGRTGENNYRVTIRHHNELVNSDWVSRPEVAFKRAYEKLKARPAYLSPVL